MNVSRPLPTAAALCALLAAPLAAGAQGMQPASGMVPVTGSMMNAGRSDRAFLDAVQSLNLTSAQRSAIASFVAQSRAPGEPATPQQRHVRSSRLHAQIMSVLTREQVQRLAMSMKSGGGMTGANGPMNGRANMSRANATTGSVNTTMNGDSSGAMGGPGTTASKAAGGSVSGNTSNGMRNAMNGRTTMSNVNAADGTTTAQTTSPVPTASSTPASGAPGGAGSQIPGKGKTNAVRGRRAATGQTGDKPGRSGAIPSPMPSSSPSPQ